MTQTNINTNMNHETDVLIIGAGLAGLSVALSLPNSLQVTVLSKDSLVKCSSYYAQGGIAGKLGSDDSVSNHVNDTLVAGDGLCHPANTGQILQQGNTAIDWLCSQGVPFTTTTPTSNESPPPDKVGESGLNETLFRPLVRQELCSRSEGVSLKTEKFLHLTREGGHSHRRIVHADDATGKHIMDTLIANAQAQSNIQLLSEHEAIELLTHSSEMEQPHCYGASVLNRSANQIMTFTAKAVVLASGGLGQLFKRATAPSVSIGDGVMMAWQAGCRLANLEFVQFHPTGLAVQGQEKHSCNFLISEAVRGEGGLLYCPVSGERFMLKVDERAELAPRDIVARAIYKQGKLNGLGYVHLDISHRPADFIKQHFPQIYDYCLGVGLDITQQPIPVAPTAHYSCGGVLTTAEGLTDVVGLYAVGEVAYTGLHGANRLASNSLLECVVVGKQIAQHLTDNLNLVANQYTSNQHTDLANSWQLPQPQIAHHQQAVLTIDSHKAMTSVRASFLHHANLIDNANVNVDTDNTLDNETDYPQKIAQLKQLMNDKMGIERNHHDLQMAYQQLEAWQFAEEVKAELKNGMAIDTSLAQLRWHRLLMLAMLMVNSAMTRTESRGGHYRNDYLNTSKLAKVSVVV